MSVQLPGGHAIEVELDAFTEPTGERELALRSDPAVRVCIATSHATSHALLQPAVLHVGGDHDAALHIPRR